MYGGACGDGEQSGIHVEVGRHLEAERAPWIEDRGGDSCLLGEVVCEPAERGSATADEEVFDFGQAVALRVELRGSHDFGRQAFEDGADGAQQTVGGQDDPCRLHEARVADRIVPLQLLRRLAADLDRAAVERDRAGEGGGHRIAADRDLAREFDPARADDREPRRSRSNVENGSRHPLVRPVRGHQDVRGRNGLGDDSEEAGAIVVEDRVDPVNVRRHRRNDGLRLPGAPVALDRVILDDCTVGVD